MLICLVPGKCDFLKFFFFFSNAYFEWMNDLLIRILLQPKTCMLSRYKKKLCALKDGTISSFVLFRSYA